MLGASQEVVEKYSVSAEYFSYNLNSVCKTGSRYLVSKANLVTCAHRRSPQIEKKKTSQTGLFLYISNKRNAMHESSHPTAILVLFSKQYCSYGCYCHYHLRHTLCPF